MEPRISRCSSRRHHAGTINRGNLIFLTFSLVILTFSHVSSYLSCYLVHFKAIFFLYLQSLNLLDLDAHLEGKATQLRHEGLGRIKIALAGMDTSSLLEILEGHFGHMNSVTSVLLPLLRSP